MLKCLKNRFGSKVQLPHPIDYKQQTKRNSRYDSDDNQEYLVAVHQNLVRMPPLASFGVLIEGREQRAVVLVADEGSQ